MEYILNLTPDQTKLLIAAYERGELSRFRVTGLEVESTVTKEGEVGDLHVESGSAFPKTGELELLVTMREIIAEQLKIFETRPSLSKSEAAEVYVKLMEITGWSQVELAKKLKVSPSHVARAISVAIKLPEDLKSQIGDGIGELPFECAYNLSRLPNVNAMRKLANRITKGRLKAEEVAAEVIKQLGRTKLSKAKPFNLDIVLSAETDLAALINAIRNLQEHDLPLGVFPSIDIAGSTTDSPEHDDK